MKRFAVGQRVFCFYCEDVLVGRIVELDKNFVHVDFGWGRCLSADAEGVHRFCLRNLRLFLSQKKNFSFFGVTLSWGKGEFRVSSPLRDWYWWYPTLRMAFKEWFLEIRASINHSRISRCRLGLNRRPVRNRHTT